MEPYSLVHYRIRLGVDPEPIWAEVQAHGGYLSFDAYGQVTFKIDSRTAYNTFFSLRWLDSCDRVWDEFYYD